MSILRLLRDATEEPQRDRLRGRIQRVIDHWAPILGVHVRGWNLRDMKLYWASTNPRTKQMTFDTKLAGVPDRYLEVTVVHELVHLIVPGHTPRFYALMDKHLPRWRRLHAEYAGKMSPHS